MQVMLKFIKCKYPEDFARRDEDKFNYRYRGGEVRREKSNAWIWIEAYIYFFILELSRFGFKVRTSYYGFGKT
jgi:hypothetical protein